MKQLIFILIILSFTMLWPQEKKQEDFASIPSRYGYEITRYPVVVFNYFIDHEGAEWTPFMYTAVQIQNDYLQFKLDENLFFSEYEITITVRDDKKTFLSKTWPCRAELTDFDLTNSQRHFQYHNFVLDVNKEAVAELIPGEYEILILVHDMLSNRDYKNNRKLLIKDSAFIGSEKYPHTDIAFFEGNQLSKTKPDSLSPTEDILEFNTLYTAFTRFYASGIDSLAGNVRLYKNQEGQKSLIVQDFVQCKKDDDGSFIVKYLLPGDIMDEGDYSLRFTLDTDSAATEVERDFSILWFTKPLYLYKVDLAVRPLKYLISPKEIEKIKELDLDELRKWFDEYWKKLDPTPETVYNELQDEYYGRVTEAVKRYSTRFKEGWETDRGMVFLLYGEPNEIENRKYAANSIPHIIWKYKKDESEQIFTFVDKNKTGEFTLLNKDPEKEQ